MIDTVLIDEKIEELKGHHWHPIDIIKVNDHIVRLVHFLGDYHWHCHNNEDELFFVYKGSIQIDVKEHENLSLMAGEFAVIPKGVEHCPRSEKGAFVLLFEPIRIKAGGD